MRPNRHTGHTSAAPQSASTLSLETSSRTIAREGLSRAERYERFRIRATQLGTRADKLSAMIVDRARRTAQAAGLDPSMPFLHAHNALCSQHYGNPWPEVDYSLARKIKYLEERSFEPYRIVDPIISRMLRDL